MSLQHEPWLVALSLIVAFQGSFVGLHLARQIGEAQGLRYRRLIASSALSLALAIWTMHFIGMLALNLPFAVDFLVLPTLISFLICVLVVGIAVIFVGTNPPDAQRIAVAAFAMGGGIVAMHYLGMSALHATLHLTHAPAFVAASIVIGVLASGMALWLGFGIGAPKSIVGSAALMALAISAMHYTAMAGTSMHPISGVLPSSQPVLSQGLLAVVVSIVAFLVSGLFMLSLVPIPGRGPAASAAAPIGAVLAADVPSGDAKPDGLDSAENEFRDEEHDAVPTTPAGGWAKSLPVERDGLRRALDVNRLSAVKAQAHYTQLFDGEETWFCPLTISEVAARLDPAIFARIHRSHIVNIDRVSMLKQSGDASQVALSTRTAYWAPVARSRNRWLKQRLEARLGKAS
ncbi:MAG: MHYT domain-containing protein [Ancalomicrobiaceae bacterium]|nr:MHYT domain-containing protein [Ancalomicrobiaceae bacterium]